MAEQNFARRIREVVEQVAPNTFQIEWSGQSRQEKLTRNSVEEVLALSLIFAFLCLVALYESWKIPFAVMLSVPTGTKKIPVAVTFSPDQNISDLIKNLRDQVAHSREVVKMSYEKIAIMFGMEKESLLTTAAICLQIYSLSFVFYVFNEFLQTYYQTILETMLATLDTVLEFFALLIKKLAKNFTYTRVLNMNNTIIEV